MKLLTRIRQFFCKHEPDYKAYVLKGEAIGKQLICSKCDKVLYISKHLTKLDEADHLFPSGQVIRDILE